MAPNVLATVVRPNAGPPELAPTAKRPRHRCTVGPLLVLEPSLALRPVVPSAVAATDETRAQETR